MCHKNILQKETFWLTRGLNPQSSWLTTVCLCSFDRNVPHTENDSCSLSSLYTSAFNIMNEPKQLSISNQHIRVPKWRAFNFAQVLFWCVFGMPSNSAIKAGLKKHACKKYWFLKKKCSPVGFEPATSWMQVSCSTHWAIWLWFLVEFFPLHRLQPATERKLATTLTCDDKLEGWVYGVRQLTWQCW